MSYSKIDKLLKKKGWTGEEVGKALVASLLNDIRNQGKRDYAPLFSQADFERMESSLTTDRAFLAYGVYRDIYNSLVDTYNRGQGLYQQFYNGYYRYLLRLKEAMDADKALQDIENYPLIMTEQQYTRVEAATRSWERGFKTSYHALLFAVISACMEKLEAGQPDEIPAELLQAIEATKAEAVTNSRILNAYNGDLGEGYYTLPDGRRSDKLSKEEWENALQEEYLKTHKLTINGQPASPVETLRHFNSERLIRGYELFFKGADAIRVAFKEQTGRDLEGDASEILDELEAEILNAGKTIAGTLRRDIHTLYTNNLDTPVVWHTYEELPEGLTKYDILRDLLGRYSGEYEDDIPTKDQLKEFKADYPALYAALEAYIKGTVPAAGSIKPAQIYRDTLSWGELIDSGIIGYRDLEISSYNIIHYLQEKGACKFADAQRAALRGIAILRDPKQYQTDAAGDYIEDKNPLVYFDSIDAIAESETEQNEIEKLQSNLILPALRFLYSYNALIKIIGEVYDIDGIEAAQFNTSQFESQIEAFNQLLYTFYFDSYGDAAEKARKRELIKEIFTPIEIEAQKPTAEAIEGLRDELSKAGISTTARKLLSAFEGLVERLYSGEGAM